MFPQEAAVDWQLDKEVWATFSQDKLICFAFFFFYLSIASMFSYHNCLLVAEDGTCSENVDNFFTILKKKEASFLTLSCVLVVSKRN